MSCFPIVSYLSYTILKSSPSSELHTLPLLSSHGSIKAHPVRPATRLGETLTRLYSPVTDNKPGKPVKKLPEEVSVPEGSSTIDIYNQLALLSNTSIHRLRITKGSDGALVPNSKDVTIDSTGLREASTIYVKDLGTLSSPSLLPISNLSAHDSATL